MLPALCTASRGQWAPASIPASPTPAPPAPLSPDADFQDFYSSYHYTDSYAWFAADFMKDGMPPGGTGWAL